MRVDRWFRPEGSLQIGEPLVSIQVVLTNASPGAPQDGATGQSHPGRDQIGKRLSLPASPAWYRHQHRLLPQGAAINQKPNQSLQLGGVGSQALSDDNLPKLSRVEGQGLPGQRVCSCQKVRWNPQASATALAGTTPRSRINVLPTERATGFDEEAAGSLENAFQKGCNAAPDQNSP